VCCRTHQRARFTNRGGANVGLDPGRGTCGLLHDAGLCKAPCGGAGGVRSDAVCLSRATLRVMSDAVRRSRAPLRVMSDAKGISLATRRVMPDATDPISATERVIDVPFSSPERAERGHTGHLSLSRATRWVIRDHPSPPVPGGRRGEPLRRVRVRWSWRTRARCDSTWVSVGRMSESSSRPASQ
jgi:hypothetical protein